VNKIREKHFRFAITYALFRVQILNLHWDKLPEQMKKDLLIKAGKLPADSRKKEKKIIK